MHIIGIGNPLIDLIAHVPESFLKKFELEKESMNPLLLETFKKILSACPVKPLKYYGGSTGNTLRHLAHFGRKCAMIGKSSSDELGKNYIHDLVKRGIDERFSFTATSSGQILCLVTPDGQRTFCDFLGASTEFSTTDVAVIDLSKTAWIHIEGYCLLNPGVVEQVARQAKKAEIKVSIDLANFKVVERFREQILSLLPMVEIVFANDAEAEKLFSKDPAKACLEMSEHCSIAAVMTGIRGGFIASKKEFFAFPAYPVHPLDTTGAGDAFIAGFLHNYLNNASLRECAKLGARLSAEIVQIDGAVLPDSTNWGLECDL